MVRTGPGRRALGAQNSHLLCQVADRLGGVEAACSLTLIRLVGLVRKADR